jgi:hypothetical protein
MKETKQSQSSKLTDVEKEALIKEVAASLPNESLFPEKVASAKALVKSINASSSKKKTSFG